MGAHPPQDLINQETRKMSNKSVPPPFFCLLSSDADVQLWKVKTVLFLSMDNYHENSLDRIFMLSPNGSRRRMLRLIICC